MAKGHTAWLKDTLCDERTHCVTKGHTAWLAPTHYSFHDKIFFFLTFILIFWEEGMLQGQRTDTKGQRDEQVWDA